MRPSLNQAEKWMKAIKTDHQEGAMDLLTEGPTYT